MLIPSSLAFDFYLDGRTSNFNSVAVSPDGARAIVSSPDGKYEGTFIERLDSSTLPPLRISAKPSDNVGFYGNNTKVIAFESEGILNIYNLTLQKTIRRVRILPGSLFTSPSGSASHIGAISPNEKKVFYIDEQGEYYLSGTKLKDNAAPIWTSSTKNGIFLAGQVWSEGSQIKMNVRSFEDEYPSTVTSSSPVSVFQGIDAAFGSNNVQRVLFSTMDEPGVVKKIEKTIWSRDPEISIISDSGDMSTVGSIITDNNLQPVLSVHYDSASPRISKLIKDSKYISLLTTRIFQKPDRCEMRHMGQSSLVSFTENPSMSPVIDIQDYSLPGRPIKRIECQSPVGVIPGENSINTFETSDSRYISYRVVSKWSTQKAKVQEAVIVPDHTGRIIGGGFSPMVSSLVQSGVPVIIIKVDSHHKNKSAMKSTAADISELAKHLLKRNIAYRVGAIFDGNLAQLAEIISTSRKMSRHFSRIEIVNPYEEDISFLRSKAPVYTQVNVTNIDALPSGEDINKNNVRIRHIGSSQKDVVNHLRIFWGR